MRVTLAKACRRTAGLSSFSAAATAGQSGRMDAGSSSQQI